MTTTQTSFLYEAFYNDKRLLLNAASLLDAKESAVAEFKPPKSKQHMVHVYLVEKDKHAFYNNDF